MHEPHNRMERQTKVSVTNPKEAPMQKGKFSIEPFLPARRFPTAPGLGSGRMRQDGRPQIDLYQSHQATAASIDSSYDFPGIVLHGRV
jgi:hypothetical protein